MILKRLYLENFGPFKEYEIRFDAINLKDQSTILLTGKNNQGKTTIITALKLLHYGSKVINNNKLIITHRDDYYFKLLENDISEINIGRMIHNYLFAEAKIIAEFKNGSTLTVILDDSSKKIFATNNARLPKNHINIFGFIPPLGQIAEQEDILSERHILNSISTTLAPRHLRNHFLQILSKSEFEQVRDIINQSWEGIELLNYEVKANEGRIYCFYKENGYDREISWAGQGLQIWFQIITHLVRLKESSILILDEPEIFLHSEKQIQLLQIIKEYFNGDIIIATHSVELMNSVDISHIIHVKKNEKFPQIKNSSDKAGLEKIRTSIGSSFNFIASAFEKVDFVLFTEDEFDFDIIKSLTNKYISKYTIHNVKVHGFMGFPNCILYKNAYEELIGKTTNFVLILDRDYYPEEQLEKIITDLKKCNIKVVYTPGKEIENLFIKPSLLEKIIPEDDVGKFKEFLLRLFESKYDGYYGSYIKLHKSFFKKDEKEIIEKYSKSFRERYNDENFKYNLVGGKDSLKAIRDYISAVYKITVTKKILVEKLLEADDLETINFINEIYCESSP
jgi:energy-coupling factor transporter ATP-binding protein EcfA2